MTQPRNQQVSVADTPYYHIVSRCVRRTFLCGYDRASGKDYEYVGSGLKAAYAY